MIYQMVGGGNFSAIIVSCDPGSTVYLSNENNVRRDAEEQGGTWYFRNVPVGRWTVYAALNDKWSSEAVEIQAGEQKFQYNVLLSYFNGYIDVTYPAGSECTCSLGDTVYRAEDTSGRYVFHVKKAGVWVVRSVQGNDSDSKNVSITADGQRETVVLSYNAIPKFSYSGEYEIVNDADDPISASKDNYKIRCLTSGTLTLQQDVDADVFLVGGGGGGGEKGGGGGGYTKTFTTSLSKNTKYSITIGGGGNGTDAETGQGGTGGTTSAFNMTAGGGTGGLGYEGQNRAGGSGGSGGGGGGNSGTRGGNGGSDGANGASAIGPGGSGQGTTTREFGENKGRLFAGGGAGHGGTTESPAFGQGGSGGGGSNSAGEANTGSGGGGRHDGGSGIVIIRNARG